jgi:hypothetical protein
MVFEQIYRPSSYVKACVPTNRMENTNSSSWGRGEGGFIVSPLILKIYLKQDCEKPDQE